MKILCLGNNTEDTDILSRQYAEQNNTVYHGLISDLDSTFDTNNITNGCYQTTIVDFSYNRLISVLNNFDKIVLLDQTIDSYNHANEFLDTIRILKNYNNIIYQNNSFKHIAYWENLVSENKSFCIFPFIEYLTNNEKTTVCCRSKVPVADKDCDFYNDKNYVNIREKLLRGEKIKNCEFCYELEERNIISARMIETVEWANRLDLKSTDDLKYQTKPSYYEIRPSNKCNLQCRMCGPQYSHLIQNEYNKLGIMKQANFGFDDFEVIDFEKLHKLYIAGGEPFVNKEFYDFLRKCVDTNNTDFELLINTNGTQLNNAFKKLLPNFSNMQFVFSIDGYKDVNHYVRWPSDWDTIIENAKYLVDNNVNLRFNITMSIYTIATLDKLLEFLEQTFPHNPIHIQFAHTLNDLLSAYHYPNNDTIVNCLKNIKKLNCYANDTETKSIIDDLDNYYSTNKDKQNLKEFFRFNDLLDKSRNIKLKDYIPELEEYRC